MGGYRTKHVGYGEYRERWGGYRTKHVGYGEYRERWGVGIGLNTYGTGSIKTMPTIVRVPTETEKPRK